MKPNHFINDLTHENYRLKHEIARLHQIIKTLNNEIDILKSVNASSLETHSRVLNYMKNKNAELNNKNRAIMPDISGGLHHVNIFYPPLIRDMSANPTYAIIIDASGHPINTHPIHVKPPPPPPTNQTVLLPPMPPRRPPRLVPPPLKSSTTHPTQEERDFYYYPYYNYWNRYPWLYPYPYPHPYLGDWHHEGDYEGHHDEHNDWHHDGGYHSD